MIIISAFETYRKGKKCGTAVIISKFKNNVNLGFDMNNPENWRLYLNKCRLDISRILKNKGLESDVSKYRFRVYTFGGLPPRTLFPQKLPLLKYGRIV